jgi:uncharacterized protein
MSRRQLVYLHGFASSPSSSKARWMAARAEAVGWGFACPDLNLPSFDTLAVSRMLGQVDELLGTTAPGPVTLVGSSLGAVIAVFAAARDRERAEAGSRVDSLVLLAPALDLVPSLEAHLGPDKLAQWERDDRLEVFHYAEGATRDLRWGFFADARGYDAYAAEVHVPTLVFQGRRDDSVDARGVEAWASRRPIVALRLLDDDHQLLGSLDLMWSGIHEFLAPLS